MSYVMCCNLTFAATDRRDAFSLPWVSSASIQSSWKMLTDTAEITLPRKVERFNGKEFHDLFQPGDPVRIELGYDNELYQEFEGYIISIGRGVPVVLRCEDEMYMLKRKTVSYSKKSVTLKQLLTDVCEGYDVKTSFGDTELGAVRYSNMKASAILEDVRKKTGLYSYFGGKTLYCGNVYSEKVDYPEVRIMLEENGVSQDLQQTGGEYEVIATAILKGGKKMEAKVGTKGADTFNLNFNDHDKKVTVQVLKDFAERFYQSLSKQKFKGGVELFGIPRVDFGMVMNLTSEINPEMNGKYFIEKVTKDFSDNATYRQKIELGGRAE